MYKIKSPVLFLVFNRPDSTKLVFEQIRKGKPDQLFIAADGPRQDKVYEQELCRQTREILQIDWECEVKTLYRKENLGCGKAVSSAIDWFFSNVPQGIILEDDCLPQADFFRFCDETLDKYADNDQILEISGTNLQAGSVTGDGSYYFSRYGGIWGWATWSRAWKKYDYNMSGLDEFVNENRLAQVLKSKTQQKYWNEIFLKAKQIDTWDYQWLYTKFKNDGICIVSNSNLIDNIGFNKNGTHTLGMPTWYSRLTSNKRFLENITHPSEIKISTKADNFLFDEAFRANKFSKIKNMLNKIHIYDFKSKAFLNN